MGESSAPRRPTHDTNTSRRQVHTNTHTYQQQQQQQHFIKYKHTMKFTGLIASTLMLLLAVMASTASAQSIEKTSHPDNCFAPRFKKEIMHGEMGPRGEACCWYGKWRDKSKWEKNPPVTHPDNCYSRIWNTEIMHGEMGARKCCWYGKWEDKSKCEKNPPVTHPDNCYSTIWNTEVMHGEMGAKKCCWYGKWERKSKCNGGHKDD